jgi:hypothetical protein
MEMRTLDTDRPSFPSMNPIKIMEPQGTDTSPYIFAPTPFLKVRYDTTIKLVDIKAQITPKMT